MIRESNDCLLGTADEFDTQDPYLAPGQLAFAPDGPTLKIGPGNWSGLSPIGEDPAPEPVNVPASLQVLAVPDDSPDQAEEFNGSTAHTLVQPSGSLVVTEARSIMSCAFASQSTSQVSGAMIPLDGSFPVGSYIEGAMYLGPAGNNRIAGFALSDGVLTTSNLVQAWVFRGTSGVVISLRGGTFAAFGSALTTESTITAEMTGPIYMRLRRTGATSWRVDLSADGVSWSTNIMSEGTATLTPTHFGPVVSRNGGGTKVETAGFEYLRVYTP